MSNKHALIIDDNTQNVAVLARLLSKQNISSTHITDPGKLDATLDTVEGADVIFLDLEMPGIDGYQVMDKLRRLPSFEGTPIIAYTVHVSEIKVAHEKGFDGFIGKPLDPDKFPNQLARILNGEAVWETA